MSFGGDVGKTAEAAELVRRAEKACKGGFLSIFTGGPNYDEASQLFVSASNKYKLNKLWREAADCLIKAAYIQQNLHDLNAEANLYNDAANLVCKYSYEDALKYYNMAINIYNGQGRFGVSAKIMRKLAENFEEEHRNEDASVYYKKAAELYDLDNYGKASYSQCILKYAELSARVNGNVEEAIEIFEKEGDKALKNTLIQYSAKEYYLKAGILRLFVGDSTSAKVALLRYKENDPRFGDSREGVLYEKLVTAFEMSDRESFVEALYDFDRVTQLDKWKTHFLLKVKESMPGEDSNDAHVTEDGQVDLS